MGAVTATQPQEARRSIASKAPGVTKQPDELQAEMAPLRGIPRALVEDEGLRRGAAVGRILVLDRIGQGYRDRRHLTHKVCRNQNAASFLSIARLLHTVRAGPTKVSAAVAASFFESTPSRFESAAVADAA